MVSLKKSSRKKIEMKYAKNYINEYFFAEFGSDPNFKLTAKEEISLAYTESDDGVPKQITTIIHRNEFYVYEDGKKSRTIIMEKTEYFKGLETMDFDWLMDF